MGRIDSFYRVSAETRIRAGFRDKYSVSLFAGHLQQIFDGAVAAARAGESPSEMTILIGEDDRISMIADSDWPLDSLARERGAKSVYRVTGGGGSVRVEGREGLRRCVMESEDPARTARLLLGA